MQPSHIHGEIQNGDDDEAYAQYRMAINAHLQNMWEKAFIKEFECP